MELTLTDARRLVPWYSAERPGYEAAAGHVLTTGNGRAWADRWPDPQVVLLGTADYFVLRGSPDAVRPAELADVVRGFVDAPAQFAPVLRQAAPRMATWQRLVYALDQVTDQAAAHVRTVPARRLTADDVPALAALSDRSSWIYSTWGGPLGAAASGRAWGAFVGGRLASVACTFFDGLRHEDVGIVTEPAYQRRGLSTACVAGLCRDILARGRRPSWSTSLDNLASQRVAVKVGYRQVRTDVLYLINIDPPA